MKLNLNSLKKIYHTNKIWTSIININIILTIFLYQSYYNIYASKLISTNQTNIQFIEPTQDKEGYYQLSDADNIKWFANQVNNGNNSINGRLISNISLNNNKELNINTIDADKWIPIGNENHPFNGILDGQNHTISGIFCNDKQINHIGLFGFTDHAIIKNIGVINSFITGKYCVGGIVGLNKGIISQCFSSNIISGEGSTGGIVGGNYGKVIHCFNTSNINSKEGSGGVIGSNWGIAEYCFNTGNIIGNEGVGGIVGLHGENQEQLVKNSYNIGSISGDKLVGGIVGAHDGGTIIDSYNESKISGNEYVGGIVGGGSAETNTLHNSNTGMIYGQKRVGGIIGGNWGNVTYNFNKGSVFGQEETSKIFGYNKGTIEYNYDMIPSKPAITNNNN